MSEEELELLNLDQEQALQQQQVEQEQQPELTKEELITYIQRTLSRQDINPNALIALDKDFYNSIQKLVSLGIDDRKLLFHMERFINFRIDQIISHSMTFSDTVFNRLSEEEQFLYCSLCENIERSKNEIMRRVKK